MLLNQYFYLYRSSGMISDFVEKKDYKLYVDITYVNDRDRRPARKKPSGNSRIVSTARDPGK